jgi:hypothetical protein
MRAAAMTSDKEGFDGNMLAMLGSKLRKTKGASVADRLALERQELAKLDGRALRATGRTEQLNLRLTAETKQKIQRIAKEKNLLLAQVIEDAIAALEREMTA